METKKGISINQLKRTIGISYKSAWYLRHRIHAALTEIDIHLMVAAVAVSGILPDGETEEEGRRCRGNDALCRGADNSKATSSHRDIEYETVRYRGKEEVGDDAQTNSIDNVCSHLKQALSGRYPQVHAKHLNAYLDEVRGQFVNGENPYMFRDAIWRLMVTTTVTDKLPY